ITHIKRTMQLVDVLYGVTMQESGVSRLVSVNMNTAMETLKPGQAGAPAKAKDPTAPDDAARVA
ncbi:MAG TPA: hypothetical protein VGH87_01875, partial [Polyangiaceae bacterium]